MTLFDWLQSCTVEELADWLVTFQSQSENNIFDSVQSQGVTMTIISIDHNLLVARMIKHLNTEIEENDD